MRYAYPAKLKAARSPRSAGRAPTTILVSFRDLPEAVTEGADSDEALANAETCLADTLWFRLRNDEEIPMPSAPKRGEVSVVVDADIAAKMALTRAFRESGMSQSQFARQLGVDRKEVRRMLDPTHATKIDSLAEAVRKLGQRLVITVEAA